MTSVSTLAGSGLAAPETMTGLTRGGPDHTVEPFGKPALGAFIIDAGFLPAAACVAFARHCELLAAWRLRGGEDGSAGFWIATPQ